MRTVHYIDTAPRPGTYRVLVLARDGSRWLPVMLGVAFDVAVRYAACRGAARVVAEA